MNKFNDLENKAKIKLALTLNPHIGGMDVGVDMVNGIAFLTGWAQDSAQKELAERIARDHGAFDVKNEIRVLSEQEDEAVKPVVTPTVDVSKENSIIRERVIGALETDSRINPFTIDIEFAGGTLHLFGYQTSDTAKERAGEIAMHVQGVREVVNAIETRK